MKKRKRNENQIQCDPLQFLMRFLDSFSLLLLALSTSMQISSSRKIGLKTEETKREPIVYHEIENSSIEFDPSKVIQVSWHPRVFLYKGFLSDKECEHLISQAHGKLVKSLVNDSDIGNNTSSTRVFLPRGQDGIVSKIEEKISAWTFLPKENGEDMQILRYNGSHAPTYDYYHDGSNMVKGGNRAATVMMYLSTVIHGGETVFPKSELKDSQVKDLTLSDCAATGYALKPVKGDALLLFNLHPDTTVDESSIHGSCTVLEGEKWTATKWIRTRAFNVQRTPSLIPEEDCTDEDDSCSHWAAQGECQRNPVYMLGTPDYYGSCRKSCGAC